MPSNDMPSNETIDHTEENTVSPDRSAVSKSEIYRALLKERAQSIKSVCNDVYTVKYWQLLLNFFLGLCAVALLIASMFIHGGAATAMITVALITAAGIAVYNIVIRKIKPMSFMQYTAVVKDRRYCFQIVSKTMYLYSDGERAVECNAESYCECESVKFPQYRFDFFADMNVETRIGKADKEIFTGTLDCDGKKLKCKIVFKNGAVHIGNVGGARIKYFDVNDRKEKFVIPVVLKKAAQACGMDIPKLPGIEIRDLYR